MSQKVPTFKLSVTLSDLNRFSKLVHYWKAYEICYKPRQRYPPYLRHVAALPWDTKNSNFLQIFSRYGKMPTNSIFSALILIPLGVTVYAECIYVFLSKSCPRR